MPGEPSILCVLPIGHVYGGIIIDGKFLGEELLPLEWLSRDTPHGGLTSMGSSNHSCPGPGWESLLAFFRTANAHLASFPPQPQREKLVMTQNHVAERNVNPNDTDTLGKTPPRTRAEAGTHIRQYSEGQMSLLLYPAVSNSQTEGECVVTVGTQRKKKASEGNW